MVFKTPEDWYAHLGEDAGDCGYCDICEVDCENPPGYGGGGGAFDNEDPPACDWCCPECGSYACPACQTTHDGEVLCMHCAETRKEEADEAPAR